MSRTVTFACEAHVPFGAHAQREGQRGSSADAERGLAVVLAVLRTLRAWDCFEQGGERLLGDLANALELEAGALWLPHEGELVAHAIWTAPGINRGPFESAVRALRFRPGVGLPGRAWLRREPSYRAAAAADGGPRGRHCLPGDLHASLAIPASAASEVLAVLELYGSSPVELTERLTQVLTALGDELGSFFARRRGELKPSPLTRREHEVLALAAVGLTVDKICERLTISPSTAKTHLEHIYAKLEVSNRTSAVAYALRAGLIQ
jgi:DNA-binding CsgD family transcriptional regulator